MADPTLRPSTSSSSSSTSASLNSPIQAVHSYRRPAPRSTSQQPVPPPPLVGAEVVASVKRGLKTHDVRSRDRRLLILLIIAFVGFVILTGFWIIRIGDKVEAAGGVQEVMDRIREMLAGPNDARLEHAFGDL